MVANPATQPFGAGCFVIGRASWEWFLSPCGTVRPPSKTKPRPNRCFYCLEIGPRQIAQLAQELGQRNGDETLRSEDTGSQELQFDPHFEARRADWLCAGPQ
jgi:hypothetical protein